MNILVVVGYCLKVNSSANLCHAQYIQGLLDCGHNVDLLTVDARELRVDNSIIMPEVDNIYEYTASLYERKAVKKKNNQVLYSSPALDNTAQNKPKNIKRKIIARIKSLVRSLYGVYGTDAGWMYKAARFKSKKEYDVLISLAYPPASHKVAEMLLKRKRIYAKKWIQIWEDPWYSDVAGMEPSDRILREEARLIKKADDIYYVSPLTLKYQKEMFPENSVKMKWQPLPSYYKSTYRRENFEQLRFGYFGDYSGSVRNLRVFYEYAVKKNLDLDICGNASEPFESVNSVAVHKRLPLDELKPHEDRANVLVFVCNKRGGQIPGKIYQYAATDKYVLFILDGTDEEQNVLHDYFKQYNRFVFCNNDASSIDYAINLIKSGTLPESYYSSLDSFAPQKITECILQGK